MNAEEALQSIGQARTWPAPFAVKAEGLKHAGLYYSLGGEDIALRILFKRRLGKLRPGTYVDIGCCAPVAISNTYLFYCHGWSGVGIDLNGGYADDWARVRPRDKFIHMAVSDTRADAYVFTHRNDPGQTRIGFSPLPPDQDFTLAGRVPTRRLDDILSETLPAGTSIQLFSIDVEGAELGVLKSNDWTKWSPEIVLMECHGFDFAAPYKEPSVQFLADHGYQLALKVGANVVMTKAEPASPPPSVGEAA